MKMSLIRIIGTKVLQIIKNHFKSLPTLTATINLKASKKGTKINGKISIQN